MKGIVTEDQPLPSNFESKPRVYGGVEISRQEEKLLELPPKYTVYNRIKREEIETEIEKAITKLRWTERERKSEESGNVQIRPRSRSRSMSDTNTEVDENAGEPGRSRTNVNIEDRVYPYNISENTLDMRHLRPTDLKFNKRVILPATEERYEESKEI